MKEHINIGLIGHQFMGKAHSHAYRDINMFFDLKHQVVMHTLCGIGDDLPEKANQYGFLHYTPDWHDVVNNPDIDVIDICTPDHFHCEIAVAAAAAGKHIICEKPLATSYPEAMRMAEAVRAAGVKSLCNFTYRGVPAIQLAKELIASGRLGKIYHVHGLYLQDFCLSPEVAFGWRMDAKMAGAAGILADKGAHLIDLSRFLVGEFNEVCAQTAIYIPWRKKAGTEEKAEVTTNDAAVFLANFEGGAMGDFALSNVCSGRKNALLLEISGSRGALKFDLERLNELEVNLEDDEASIRGFRVINVTERCHPYMSHWWPAGHLIGWEHTFIHQIYGLLHAVEEDTANESTFFDGLQCQRVVDALDRSQASHRWVNIEEIGC